MPHVGRFKVTKFNFFMVAHFVPYMQFLALGLFLAVS